MKTVIRTIIGENCEGSGKPVNGMKTTTELPHSVSKHPIVDSGLQSEPVISRIWRDHSAERPH